MENRFKIGDEVWIKAEVAVVPKLGSELYCLQVDNVAANLWIGADRLNAVTIPEGWTITTIKKYPEPPLP